MDSGSLKIVDIDALEHSWEILRRRREGGKVRACLEVCIESCEMRALEDGHVVY